MNLTPDTPNSDANAVVHLTWQVQHLFKRIATLEARLFGDPDSGGTDCGEVGRLQRDVEHLMGYAVVRRRTVDEQATDAAATS